MACCSYSPIPHSAVRLQKYPLAAAARPTRRRSKAPESALQRSIAYMIVIYWLYIYKYIYITVIYTIVGQPPSS